MDTTTAAGWPGVRIGALCDSAAVESGGSGGGGASWRRQGGGGVSASDAAAAADEEALVWFSVSGCPSDLCAPPRRKFTGRTVPQLPCQLMPFPPLWQT